MRFNSVVVIASFIGVACSREASTRGALGEQQSAPVFLVTTIRPDGRHEVHAAVKWNSAVDEDTVLVAIAAGGAKPQSLELWARSGPLEYSAGSGLPDPTVADARGSWKRLPDSLLARGKSLGIATWETIGFIVPRQIEGWVASTHPQDGVTTRIAVDAIAANGDTTRIELHDAMSM